jgi:superkiller protein 3
MNNFVCEDLTSIYTKSAEKSFLENGNEHFGRKKYFDAIAQYNIAIKINPDNPCSYYNKAVALMKLGDHDEAVKSFDIVMQINPNYFKELNSNA